MNGTTIKTIRKLKIISLRLYVGHPLCCKNETGNIETVGHCCVYIPLYVAIQQTAQFKKIYFFLQLTLLIFPLSLNCNCCHTFQPVSLAHNLHFQPATSPSTSLLILQFGYTQNKYVFWTAVGGVHVDIGVNALDAWINVLPFFVPHFACPCMVLPLKGHTLQLATLPWFVCAT